MNRLNKLVTRTLARFIPSEPSESVSAETMSPCAIDNLETQARIADLFATPALENSPSLEIFCATDPELESERQQLIALAHHRANENKRANLTHLNDVIATMNTIQNTRERNQ